MWLHLKGVVRGEEEETNDQRLAWHVSHIWVLILVGTVHLSTGSSAYEKYM